MLLDKMIENYGEMVNQFKGDFPLYFADLFSEFTDLEYFSITGYTPSFNDGDPCIFRISSHGVDFKMLHDEETLQTHIVDGNYDEDYESVIDVKVLKSVAAAINGITDKLSKVEPLMQAVFGSNFQLDVYSDKLVEKEYDCGY
jgi:hypothetical protein